jgi:hypothetical protein
MAQWTPRAVLSYLLTAMIAYAVGYFQSTCIERTDFDSGIAAKGKVLSLDDIEAKPVNHDLPEGALDKRPIMKRVMISNGEIPHLTGFSAARLEAGQEVPRHSHKTMHEVFYVKGGTGAFEIDGKRNAVKLGTLM